MAGPAACRDRGAVGPLDGLGAFAGGTGFVVSTPSVWGWALVPVGVLALLSLGLCGLSSGGVWEASKQLLGEVNLGTWALTDLSGLLGAMLAVLLALALAQPFSGRRPCDPRAAVASLRQRGGRHPSWPVVTTWIAACL
jgi:hypothetical protein